jgi:8-oxo-dGTP diphosphatase
MIPPMLNTMLVVVLIAVLLFNLSQRSHLQHGEAKRFASLHLALIILFLYGADIAIRRWALPAWSMIAALLIAAAAAYLMRRRIFIFRRRCLECGTSIPLRTTLYEDDNLCGECRSGREWPYESSERMDPKSIPATVDEIDWESWSPSETAVLCYVISDGQVLLINKKTGLGKGMVNAPGGRIEGEETPEEAAVRELEEEVGITPEELSEVARLSFIFTNGFSLSGTVFFASSYSGEPHETDEAEPFWIPLADIPYENMWADDKVWLPKALAGYHVTGRFIFRDEEMLSKRIVTRLREGAVQPNGGANREANGSAP